MNIVEGIILVNVLFIVVGIIVIVIIKRKEIMAFFRPDDWAYVTMFESDNNVSEWLEKKNPDLRFEFNEGFYNMFESEILIKEGEVPKFKKSATSIYRSGRLANFVYIEGNENPIDVRSIKATGNPQLNKQLLKTDLSKLFNTENTPLEDFMKNIMPFIIIIGIIIIIIIILRKPETAVQTAQTAVQR